MTGAYRVRLGSKNQHADECFRDGFIGVGYGFTQDFTGELVDNWRKFNKKFIPVYMDLFPNKTKIAAGLACGTFWTVCKGICIHDLILSPDMDGNFRVGKITGEYQHQPKNAIPQQRPLNWLGRIVRPDEMSESLFASCKARGTVVNISKHISELEQLLTGSTHKPLDPKNNSLEGSSSFAMEKHLEEFLIKNWKQSGLGHDYDIYEQDGELVGQQFPTDTGPMDILAISKDKQTLLVVELKRGRAGDVVVGQILRYMGYVKEELAEDHQAVKGVIIAMDDTIGIQRALSVIHGKVDFYRYEVSFKLIKN
ncbi:hypothetical protein COB72_08065 [bacterium]|nr:MAG: hypothetical protein COB72_08065 [bacterium]